MQLLDCYWYNYSRIALKLVCVITYTNWLCNYYYYTHQNDAKTGYYNKNKQQKTTKKKKDTYNNQSNKCQSIAKGRDAPSTIPKHLHLVRDPLTHNIVA